MVLLRGNESYPFYFGASADLLYKAGVLRRNMTPAEKVLWEHLRNRKMEGLRFRRQHPIDIFVVDFFCYEKMLVVEVDGGIHDELNQAERDNQRTIMLNKYNIRVIRFTNEQVMKEIRFVLNQIRNAIKEYTER